MSKQAKYEVRFRKDVTNSLSPEMTAAFAAIGGGTAKEITTFTVSLSSIQEIFEKTKDIEALKDQEIISIVLIDTDNSDLLGEDFEYDEDDDS